MTKRVLQWVNRQRIAAGQTPLKRLPQGFIHDADNCPLARALAGVFTESPDETLWVYPTGLEISNQAEDSEWTDPYEVVRRVAIPAYVGDAIKRFDKGQYPDLVLGGF